jgi:hypothetical protein
LPLLPEPAAAVTLGTWQSMLRAPEVKMALGMAFVVTVIAGAYLLTSRRLGISGALAPFVATGAIAFSLFMLSQFLANQFGYDREGFRTFVLAPIDRRWILLGKNAATATVGGVFGLAVIAALAFRLDLGLAGIAAVLMQLGATLCLGSLGGNVLSILVPFRIEPGSNKPTKMPGMARLVMVVAQMLLPVVLTPIFIPPALEWIWRRAEWPMAGIVNMAASAVVLCLAVGAYWLALASIGRLLQRREIRILEAVTAGQE